MCEYPLRGGGGGGGDGVEDGSRCMTYAVSMVPTALHRWRRLAPKCSAFSYTWLTYPTRGRSGRHTRSSPIDSSKSFSDKYVCIYMCLCCVTGFPNSVNIIFDLCVCVCLCVCMCVCVFVCMYQSQFQRTLPKHNSILHQTG